MQNGLKFLMGMLLVSSSSLMAKELHNSYSLSLVGMSMDYKEYAPQLIDSEKSSFTDIGGFEIAYGYLLTEESKLNVSVMYVAGDTAYVGSLLNSKQPYGSATSTTSNYIVDTALNYKRYSKVNDGLRVDSGVGLGYRYWERKLSRVQIEGYEWFSLRAYVGLTQELNTQFSVTFGAEYQYALQPTMSATNIGRDFDLGSANIIKGNVSLLYSYTPTIDIFMDASLEKQSISKSNVISSGGVSYFEPDSTAYNQYLKFGIVLKY